MKRWTTCVAPLPSGSIANSPLNFSGRIAAHFSLASPNPFADWDIFQRYHHERFFDKTRIDAHRNATQVLQNKVQELFINGVLT